jgi:hypothetical protein
MCFAQSRICIFGWRRADCAAKPIGARSAKVGSGFASDRAPIIKWAHDLFANPLALWRIMRRNRDPERWI